MTFNFSYKPNPKISDIYNSLSPGSIPWNSMLKGTSVTTPVTRNLPNNSGSYTAPIVTPENFVPKVETPTPVVTQTPVFNQPTQTPTPQKSNIPPQYINPATGGLYSPQEFADVMAKTIPTGDIPKFAGDTLMQGPQTAEQLASTAAGLNNARNDIATGTVDPYSAASKSGVAYSPAEMAAIEKAYAGVYDPAINTALAKLERKQKEDELKSQQDFEMQKLAKQHEYTMAEKAATGGAGLTGGVYTPGANPQVDAMAELIWNGKATMASVPKEYKMAVASAMQTYGNQINGKPTTTEIGKQKLAAAKKLLAMFDKGEGTSVVGKSRLFGGGVATPGSKSADFYSLSDQLMAIAQLDASKFLKGQGQVSDAERAILANAATSLKYSQSEELFRKTLVDMINVLEGNVPPEEVGANTEKPQTMILNGQTLTLQADGTYE